MTAPYITINLAALCHNLAVVKQNTSGKAILAMVKANAYGHGIIHVSHAMQPLVDYFGVARIDEAQALRQQGIVKPIVLMTGVFSIDQLIIVCQLKVDLVIHHQDHIKLLSQLPAEYQPPRIWLKVNTGMQRLGFRLQDIPAILSQLMAKGIAQPKVVMTHFADAETDSTATIKMQLSPFLDMFSSTQMQVSIANSAAIIEHHELVITKSDIIRPGRMLYGISPNNKVSINSLGLQSVMSLYAYVIAINQVYPGESIGYERAYTAIEEETIAIINIGYADGYPKITNGHVYFKGERCPIRGWVSMDMMAIAIPTNVTIQLGDSVELWGENLSIEEVSQAIGRSALDIMIPIANRVRRCYLNQDHVFKQIKKVKAYETV